MRLLIDTDMGGDVDDALALALAFNSREIDVAGISLVYMANQWRADILKNMLQVFDCADIPFVIGAEQPIIGRWNDYEPNRTDNRAAEFIIENCEKFPDLVIAPIGPLTNIAAAFAAAPRIAIGRKVMLMGGAWNEARAEWNMLCDPEAAHIVLNAGADITMVGLNVTERCRFSQAEVDLFAAAGPKGRLLYDMMTKFINEHYLPVLHDPLAIGALLWDDIITFEKKQIAVELGGAYSRGMLVETAKGAEVRIATQVDAKRFNQRLIERICV